MLATSALAFDLQYIFGNLFRNLFGRNENDQLTLWNWQKYFRQILANDVNYQSPTMCQCKCIRLFYVMH